MRLRLPCVTGSMHVGRQVLGHESVMGVGAGSLDSAMMAHFAVKLDAKHGEGTCGSAKAQFRLRNACER